MKIAVSDLRPNPFRHLEHYPIRRDKVDALKASIKSTEFWDNLLARKNGTGFQIAYGHHRLTALKELKVKEVDIPVRNLDDATMLKIMAHENMEEWGASAVIEQETVRSVVQAFAEGRIELPKISLAGGSGGTLSNLRIAPSFLTKPSVPRGTIGLYTTKSVAEWLGWKEHKVKDALAALAFNEEAGGTISFENMTPRQARQLVQEAHYAEHQSGDKKLAIKIAKQVANEFRNGLHIESARALTQDLLLENKVKTYVKKKEVWKDKRELERFDRQVAMFLQAMKYWDEQLVTATKAISKFSPEAKRFAIRRLDKVKITEAAFRKAAQ